MYAYDVQSIKDLQHRIIAAEQQIMQNLHKFQAEAFRLLHYRPRKFAYDFGPHLPRYWHFVNSAYLYSDQCADKQYDNHS